MFSKNRGQTGQQIKNYNFKFLSFYISFTFNVFTFRFRFSFTQVLMDKYVFVELFCVFATKPLRAAPVQECWNTTLSASSTRSRRGLCRASLASLTSLAGLNTTFYQNFCCFLNSTLYRHLNSCTPAWSYLVIQKLRFRKNKKV